MTRDDQVQRPFVKPNGMSLTEWLKKRKREPSTPVDHSKRRRHAPKEVIGAANPIVDAAALSQTKCAVCKRGHYTLHQCRVVARHTAPPWNAVADSPQTIAAQESPDDPSRSCSDTSYSSSSEAEGSLAAESQDITPQQPQLPARMNSSETELPYHCAKCDRRFGNRFAYSSHFRGNCERVVGASEKARAHGNLERPALKTVTPRVEIADNGIPSFDAKCAACKQGHYTLHHCRVVARHTAPEWNLEDRLELLLSSPRESEDWQCMADTIEGMVNADPELMSFVDTIEAAKEEEMVGNIFNNL